jgi:putative Ca2+/H+ antiporter (TMEM165/GDT1 family)
MEGLRRRCIEVAWRDLASFLFLSYWTVLTAELIGDRSIYTVTSLAVRFPARLVYCGLTIAFMGKMLAAVLLGRALVHLPLTCTSAISAATFFGSAICIWHRRGRQTVGREAPSSWHGAVAVSFLSIFFSEWADFGQISAAALVTKFNAPVPIWLGGSLALCSKAALAMTLGLNLRRRIPDRLARALSTSSCIILGLVSLYDLIPSRP